MLEYDATGAQTETYQQRMVREVSLLTERSDGRLDPADYERTVATLLQRGSDPVINREPEGAWTHRVADRALGN